MVSRPGESVFSYPLTRHYPFRWFTWVVILGGLILATLFSFVAVAADGYNPATQYTTDLNGTLAQKHWFDKAPFSWARKVEVSCEPALLSPGITYFTSNLGLQYTLDAIWKERLDSSTDNSLPAAPYKNASLANCAVRQISIDFQRLDNTRLPTNWWSWQRTSAKATTTCTVYAEELGALQANFTVELPQISENSRTTQKFLSLDVSTRPNMWFGAQLLSSWYGHLSSAMGFSAPNDNDSWDSGSVQLTRNPNIDDYTDLAFFQSYTWFTTNRGGFNWMLPPDTIADWENQWVPTWVPPSSPDHLEYNLPNISTSVDAFAKTFYSLLLSDFGVTDASNALLTPDGVQYLQTRNDTNLAIAAAKVNSPVRGQGVSIPNVTGNGYGYDINNAYQGAVKDLGYTPVLNGTAPDTTSIFAQYLCTVPKLKSGGSLFVSILIADIVFLNVCWVLLGIGATWWLERKDPQMNQCSSCRMMATASSTGTIEEDASGTHIDGREILPIKENTGVSYSRLENISEAEQNDEEVNVELELNHEVRDNHNRN